MATKPKQEVAAVTEPSDDELELAREAAGIDFIPETWEDVVAAAGGEIIEFEGSPWEVVDKDVLIGVPFLICDVRIYASKQYGNNVAAICVMTKDNDRLIINDGSTGIYQQVLHMLRTTKRKSGIMCPNGLRKSTYKVTVVDGMNDTEKEIEASTFYVA